MKSLGVISSYQTQAYEDLATAVALFEPDNSPAPLQTLYSSQIFRKRLSAAKLFQDSCSDIVKYCGDAEAIIDAFVKTSAEWRALDNDLAVAETINAKIVRGTAYMEKTGVTKVVKMDEACVCMLTRTCPHIQVRPSNYSR